MSDFVKTQAAAWTQIRQQFLGHVETPNGPGSHLAATDRVREWLPDILEEGDFKTMLDAPCGDWNWMQHVDLSGLDLYIGMDVEPEQIKRNHDQFSRNASGLNPGPTILFECVNLLTEEELPKVDLIWCRDLMIHLPDEQNLRILRLFQESGSRYLAATTDTRAANGYHCAPEGDDDRPGYWCHAVNLEAAPYHLPPPVAMINDVEGRQMALFDLSEWSA